MNVSLGRIILYVRDVPLLAAFYREMLGLSVVEEIGSEWVALKAGPCELGLHRVGAPFRTSAAGAPGSSNNAKLVFTVDTDLTALRARLMAAGVPLGEIKSYSGTGPLCDGADPEGNVFHLSQA